MCSSVASEKPFYAMMTKIIPNLSFVGFGSPCQCFPFYTYKEDGTNRRENITAWSLQQFHVHYKNDSITKWDIFYYIYGLLHHTEYRKSFKDCLRRDLPRIPFAPEFQPFAKAGEKLAKLHLEYESVEPYDLKWVETPDTRLDYRVEKMKLNKEKTAVIVNDSLTLKGIPPETFDYLLRNRSALDWIIDQYRVKTDKRFGIVSDPNHPDNEMYIIDLIGKIVHISIETVSIVNRLPDRAW